MSGEWLDLGLGSWSPTADGGRGAWYRPGTPPGLGELQHELQTPCFLTHPPCQSDGTEDERCKLCAERPMLFLALNLQEQSKLEGDFLLRHLFLCPRARDL